MSAYSGTGSYTASASDETGGGSETDSGSQNSMYNSSIQLSLVDGSWMQTGGTGMTSDGSTSQDSYSGSGSYNSDSSSGSYSESGFDTTSYSDSTSMSSSGSGWTETGSGTNSESTRDTSSYSGGGSSTNTTALGDIDNTGKENGNSTGAAQYTTQLELVDGSWQDVAGSGQISGNSVDNYSYKGTGDYDDGTENSEGTLSASGNGRDSSNYTARMSDSGDGNWTMAAGFQTQQQSGTDTSSYSGSGDLEKTVAGFTVTGDQSAKGSNTASYTTTTHFDVEDGAWSDHDGFGSTQGNSNTYSDYGGDGSYTLPSSSGNMNGTQSIQGSDSTKSNYNTNSTDEDGDWTEGGTQHDSASGYSYADYGASGSFTGNFNGVAITGKQSASGSTFTEHNVSKDFSDDNKTWTQDGGDSVNNEDDTTNTSFNGSGTYHTPNGTDATAENISGTLSDSGGEATTFDGDNVGSYHGGQSNNSGNATKTDNTTSKGTFTGSGTYRAQLVGALVAGNAHRQRQRLTQSTNTTSEFKYASGGWQGQWRNGHGVQRGNRHQGLWQGVGALYL